MSGHVDILKNALGFLKRGWTRGAEAVQRGNWEPKDDSEWAAEVWVPDPDGYDEKYLEDLKKYPQAHEFCLLGSVEAAGVGNGGTKRGKGRSAIFALAKAIDPTFNGTRQQATWLITDFNDDRAKDAKEVQRVMRKAIKLAEKEDAA